MAVNLIDRYLSSLPVIRRRLQLVGVTAMFVAAKFEERTENARHARFPCRRRNSWLAVGNAYWFSPQLTASLAGKAVGGAIVEGWLEGPEQTDPTILVGFPL